MKCQLRYVEWEYLPAPDAEARLKAAYDLIFSYPQEADLTANPELDNMSHVAANSPVTPTTS